MKFNVFNLFISKQDPCADSLNESSLALSAPAEDAAQQAEEGTVTDEDERPAWSSKFLYILAQVGFSVGLGNVWRFPYLCQKNGGGAFLVPYVILLLLIGIPLFFLELALGQLIRRGCIGVWNHISPRLGDIGFASFVAGFFAALYYNVISFQEPLPWKDCPLINECNHIVPECEKSSATTYYWYREALDISNSISESGGLNWKMTSVCWAHWIIVCLSMMKGIQTSGKVSGTGLAFIAFTEAMTHFPGSPFWSVMFFLNADGLAWAACSATWRVSSRPL
uniref:Transporter n=1 Tax=Astyanax mexicanus TaxID=7994 RepID=A0A3B1KDQ1_ASTMX